MAAVLGRLLHSPRRDSIQLPRRQRAVLHNGPHFAKGFAVAAAGAAAEAAAAAACIFTFFRSADAGDKKGLAKPRKKRVNRKLLLLFTGNAFY